MPFTLNPVVAANLAKLFGPTPPPEIPAGDVANRRIALDGLFAALAAGKPQPTGVTARSLTTTAPDGHVLQCTWYTPATSPPSSTPTSAILYAHGGGMIALSIAQYAAIMATYVALTSVPLLAVEYRLAPEARAPTAVTDMYAGLELLVAPAAALGVDPRRIVIMGDSAGGGITAALAHYAKARPLGPQPAKQILVYPMLDDRNVGPHPDLAGLALWKPADNVTGWDALLGERRGTEGVTPIEAPARMTVEDARGLPPAYIDVGELDIFRDEDLEYARTLGRAAVSVEFHLLPGLPHAFEGVAPELEATRATMALRAKAILSV